MFGFRCLGKFNKNDVRSDLYLFNDLYFSLIGCLQGIIGFVAYDESSPLKVVL